MGEAEARYSRVKASDVGRDGCGYELWDGTEQIAEVFRSDRERRMTLTLWREDLDLDLIESFLAEARCRLSLI